MQAHLRAESWRGLLLDRDMIEQLGAIEARLKKEVEAGKKIFPELGACFEALDAWFLQIFSKMRSLLKRTRTRTTQHENCAVRGVAQFKKRPARVHFPLFQ